MKYLLAFLLSLSINPLWAADNAVVVTTGSGLTLRSRDVGSGVQSLQQILGDTAGNGLATAPGTPNASFALPIQGVTSGTPVPISGSLTNISGTISLPTGAATSALQTTINTSLTTINTTLGSPMQNSGGSVLAQPAPVTSGGLISFSLEPAASDNHQNIVNGAHQVYHIVAFNNSATINYYRLYNAGTGFNGCGSATGLIWEGHIPANISDAGFIEDIAQGLAFSTGISICVTGAYGKTDTTAAIASAISFNVGYK